MNKIILAIEKADKAIAAKNLPQTQLAELSKSLDMALDEYCCFQTLKSNAVGGQLTLDEANTIYGYLGNIPEHFNRQPLAVKWTLTEVFRVLLGNRIKK